MKKSTIKFLVVGILFLIFFLPFIQSKGFVANNSLMEDASGFFNSFEYLMHGDTESFIDSFGQGLFFIGLFLVVFVILYYLFTTALKTFFNKKAAFIMSSVLTIYFFAEQRIYNYLLSMNMFLIAFIVFLALSLMLWGTTDSLYGNAKEEHNLFKEQKEAQKSVKDEIRAIKKEIKEIDESDL